MNSLQDLIKRLSNIGQVTEAKEKCSEFGKNHEGDCDKEILLDKDKVDESKKKKPDEDGDGIPDWVKGEKVKEGSGDGDSIGALPKQTSPEQPYEVPFGSNTNLVFARGKRSGLHYAMMQGMLSDPWYFKFNGKVYSLSDNGDGVPKEVNKAVEEGFMDTVKKGVKAVDKFVTGGDKEDLLKDLKDKAGVRNPENGKPSMAISDVEKQKQVKETALNLLRRYAGIQETKIEEEDVEEGGKFGHELQKARAAGHEEFEVDGKKYKVNECGDMSMGPEMSPMSAVSNMASPIQVIGNPEAEIEPGGPHMEVPMAAEEPKATYTLNIQNGDNNLSMTTDMPDEIIHIMKLAGVNKGAEVSKKETPADGEQEVEESGYENTPDNTRARDPQAFGDIRDWGQKGTGTGKPNYPGTKASGDNPMNEQRMFQDYKNFKAGK